MQEMLLLSVLAECCCLPSPQWGRNTALIPQEEYVGALP